MQLIEISDLLVDHDPGTRLAAAGDRSGTRIAAGLACDDDGNLDPLAVDRRLVAVHTELQRLSDELRLGDRIAELLRPLLAVIRTAGRTDGPLRGVALHELHPESYGYDGVTQFDFYRQDGARR